MFTCVGNKYTQPAPCGGPTGCTVTQTKKIAKVTCDNGAPAPDPNDKGDKKGEKKKKH
jgi:hypothetical protein